MLKERKCFLADTFLPSLVHTDWETSSQARGSPSEWRISVFLYVRDRNLFSRQITNLDTLGPKPNKEQKTKTNTPKPKHTVKPREQGLVSTAVL